MFKLRRLQNQFTTDDSRQSLSLKQRAIRGSVWAIIGHGTSQILRLGGNLILTRLLFPEAFGLMALVQTFMVGLEMFSDIGIAPSIIQNKRGNDPAFLNTAWTIQVMRGFILWLCTFALAFPAAQFYREPMLMQLLPVVGINAVISGLNSTKLATSNRRIALGRLTLVDLGSYILGLILMVIGAWIYPSVWALVLGGIVSALTKMILSHVVLEGEKNHLQWDQKAFEELQRFGRWIFISTVLGFIAAQGDRLVLARLLDVRFLGVYTVALGLSTITNQVIDQVGNKVLFPSYAELVRDRPERLYPILRKSRVLLIALSSSLSIVFILFGEKLIDLLYDDRYATAGWILQVLSIGMMVRALSLTYGNFLLAKGKTFLLAVLIAINICVQFTAMYLGNYWGGYHGVIVGIASTNLIMYAVDAVCYARLSVWQPEVDLPVIALASVMAMIVYFN